METASGPRGEAGTQDEPPATILRPVECGQGRVVVNHGREEGAHAARGFGVSQAGGKSDAPSRGPRQSRRQVGRASAGGPVSVGATAGSGRIIRSASTCHGEREREDSEDVKAGIRGVFRWCTVSPGPDAAAIAFRCNKMRRLLCLLCSRVRLRRGRAAGW